MVYWVAEQGGSLDRECKAGCGRVDFWGGTVYPEVS